ncbi:MAG: RES family NAD+ phosphorylase [Acidobacteriota bacterium]
MTVYRVVRSRYADLSGDGAKLYGGRFNPPAIAAVYASQSISLALLEVLVHLDKREVPGDYVVMAIQIDRALVARHSTLSTLEIRHMKTRAFVNKFYSRPALEVPSVIVPREFNYVLLPEAPAFTAKIDWIEPLQLDDRLFQSAAAR